MSPTSWTENQYPFARRSDHVDVYKSQARVEVKVPDPYRWLEENSSETEQWTTAQEGFTRTYLDRNLDRQKLEDEIRRATDYQKVCLT
jgi:prolyl oligopeptidase